MRIRMTVGIVGCVLLGGLAIGSASALAERQPIERTVESGQVAEWLFTSKVPPEEQIEGACGLAISPPPRDLFVSDYYHRAIDAFTLSGQYDNDQIVFSTPDPIFGSVAHNAFCGLAFDAAGALYANEWHENVTRLRPTVQILDSGESTGVAVDEAGRVYVDDRTYVAVYEPSGEPLLDKEGEPVRIGVGSLDDAYGVAAFEGKVYVPDAADEVVEVYEPAVEPSDPVATIDGPEGSGFNSLVDAAVTVDTSGGEGRGNLLVVDNLEPLHENPQAAIYEFDATGNFLGKLKSRTYKVSGVGFPGPVFGGPSGIVVDPGSGDLYVTTGNSEQSNVFKYGPYEASSPAVLGPQEDERSAPGGPASAARTSVGAAGGGAVTRQGGAGTSVVKQRGPVRVSFDGKLTPHRLPRHGVAPVGIAVNAKIAATQGGTPPQLRRIAIEINRNGHFSPGGLPVCRLQEIQPSTTAGALAACGSSLVGEGHFSANVKLPEQSPFPSAGKVLVFNGRDGGKPAILAHIYGTQPAPTSNVLPFSIRDSHGTYGTILEASLPQATGDWGFVTGLRMTLRRRFSYRGKERSYLTAGCPAPAGFPGAVFPLARTSFDFAGGLTLVSVLSRSCTARG